MMVKYVCCPYCSYLQFTAYNFENDLYTEYCKSALKDPSFLCILILVVLELISCMCLLLHSRSRQELDPL